MSLEKQAVEAFRNNNFNESLKLLKKFIETNPNSNEAYKSQTAVICDVRLLWDGMELQEMGTRIDSE